MRTSKLLAITAATILAAASANAALLLHEPFDYTTGAIAGKGGAETGFDGGSTWTENSGKTTEVQAGSIGFGTMVTTGNKFHYRSPSGTDLNRFATRSMNPVVASGDLFITYVMQGPGGVRLNGGVYVNGAVAREFGALRSQYNVTSGGTGGFNARPTVFYGNASANNTDPNISSATTYMYVQKYTGLGSGTGGTAELWAITAASYDTISADGTVTTAELDANNAYKALMTLAGVAPTLDGSEGLRLHFHDNGSGAADYILDEVRIATTLNEAMAVIPEPSSLALLGLGGLALLRRRRK